MTNAHFTAEALEYQLAESIRWSTSEPVISNDDKAPAELGRTLHLKPYGAYVYVLTDDNESEGMAKVIRKYLL